jgi:hypothetical protein
MAMAEGSMKNGPTMIHSILKPSPLPVFRKNVDQAGNEIPYRVGWDEAAREWQRHKIDVKSTCRPARNKGECTLSSIIRTLSSRMPGRNHTCRPTLNENESV